MSALPHGRWRSCSCRCMQPRGNWGQGGRGGRVRALGRSHGEPGASGALAVRPRAPHPCSCSPPGCGRELSPAAERRTPFPRLVSPAACPHAPRGASDMNAGCSGRGGAGPTVLRRGEWLPLGQALGEAWVHTQTIGVEIRSPRTAQAVQGGPRGAGALATARLERAQIASARCCPHAQHRVWKCASAAWQCDACMLLSGGISCNQPILQPLWCLSCPTRSVPLSNRYVTTAEEPATHVTQTTRRRAGSLGASERRKCSG